MRERKQERELVNRGQRHGGDELGRRQWRHGGAGRFHHWWLEGEPFLSSIFDVHILIVRRYQTPLKMEKEEEEIMC